MKRLAYLVLAFCLVFALSMGASADQVEQSGLHASVSEDGSCQVSMSVSLFMEVPDRTMRFPIPQSATNVQLNGAGVGTYQSGQTQYVDLSGDPSMDIRVNPNGSIYAIEGLTSPDGRVLGKMGHSERSGADLYRNVPGNKYQPLFEGGMDYFKL